MDFRQLILKELGRRKLSRHKLAQLCDSNIVSRTTIYDWLRGDCDITDRKLAEILQKLNIKKL
jgi:transcriptional regulator with XRE-family HTH domain